MMALIDRARMQKAVFLGSVILFCVAFIASAGPVAYEQGSKASVLIFVTTECPVANAMMPEVAGLKEAYGAKGVGFTLVYVDPATTSSDAVEHAKRYGVNARVLVDPQHALVEQFKAERTPEAFLVMQDGAVAYHGRINDLYYAPGRRRREPHAHDLRNAIEAVLAQRKPKSAYDPAVGCVIADFRK